MSFDWNAIHLYRASKQPFPQGYPDAFRDFFSPQDGPGIHQLLVDLIEAADTDPHGSAVLNMFGFDDDDANAGLLKLQQNPNCYFQASLDSSQAGGVHEKKILALWDPTTIGTSIAIGQSAKHAISHLKVLIINGLYVVTGSTNWSISGEEQQDNQLTVIRSAIVAATYRSILDVNHGEMLRQMASKRVAA